MRIEREKDSNRMGEKGEFKFYSSLIRRSGYQKPVPYLIGLTFGAALGIPASQAYLPYLNRVVGEATLSGVSI